MRRVLVLTGDASDGLAVVACQELGRLGMSVTVGGLEGSGVLLRRSRYCDLCVGVASTRREMEETGAAVMDRVERLARQSGVEFVLGADVPGGVCAARLRARLPDLKYFPSLGAETLLLMDNKWTFHQFLTKYGFPTPRAWLVESLDAARDLPLPVVLKPLDMLAGLGVRVVTAADEFDLQLDEGEDYLRPPFLAQEFVEGQDGSLSFLADRGRLNAWTIHTRRVDGTRTYIEDDRVLELGRRIARVSSYTGLANIGLRFARDSVQIIECNPRIWSSLPYTAGLGVDYVGRMLEMAEGRVPSPLARSPTGECAGLRVLLKRLASGGKLSVCESAYLRDTARDPLPALARGVRRLFGLRGAV